MTIKLILMVFKKTLFKKSISYNFLYKFYFYLLYFCLLSTILSVGFRIQYDQDMIFNLISMWSQFYVLFNFICFGFRYIMRRIIANHLNEDHIHNSSLSSL